MTTQIDEIGDRVFRIHTPLDVVPGGFSFVALPNIVDKLETEGLVSRRYVLAPGHRDTLAHTAYAPPG